MLRGEALAATRGDRVLFKDLGFALGAGEMLHVGGPNGSGKTTLLRLICGLVLPASGHVLWNDRDIRALAQVYRAELAYCGHHAAVKDELTGLENLRFASQLGGRRTREREALEALEAMGLAEVADVPARAMSQGQRRRVGLTRLLLTPARLWVLDEPFTALDQAAVERLRTTLVDHLLGGGLVVLTTHQAVAFDDAVPVRRIEMG